MSQKAGRAGFSKGAWTFFNSSFPAKKQVWWQFSGSTQQAVFLPSSPWIPFLRSTWRVRRSMQVTWQPKRRAHWLPGSCFLGGVTLGLKVTLVYKGWESVATSSGPPGAAKKPTEVSCWRKWCKWWNGSMRMAIVEFGVSCSWNKGHSSLNDKYMGRFVFGIFWPFIFCFCLSVCIFYPSVGKKG